MKETTAEKILSILAELYADQNNVKIKYHIVANNEERREGKK